jgi:hypothetical protein
MINEVYDTIVSDTNDNMGAILIADAISYAETLFTKPDDYQEFHEAARDAPGAFMYEVTKGYVTNRNIWLAEIERRVGARQTRTIGLESLGPRGGV